jgi:lipoyl(octanoyl) transferase
MHGFSLNVNNNLDIFDDIIPCGLNNIEVTSIEKELNRNINIEAIFKILSKKFVKVFELKID